MRHIFLSLLVFGVAAAQEAPEGEQIYKGMCGMCHDFTPFTKAPGKDTLAKLPPDLIVKALTSGSMTMQGEPLSAGQRLTVAQFLSKLPMREAVPMQGTCPAGGDRLPPYDARPHWNGWGVDLANTRFQPAAQAGLTAAKVPDLKLKWAFGFRDDISAYSQPTIAMGRLFVGSQGGTVYSLDSKSGCIRWSFGGIAGVRTSVAIGALGDGSYAAYFGDLQANVYALDAATGKLLWKRKVDQHPVARITGSLQVYQGKVYVPVASREEWFAAVPMYECCTFRGSLVALDASTGAVAWQTYTIPDPPKVTGVNKLKKNSWGPAGAGIWSTPTIDEKKHLIYAVTGDNYVKPTTSMSDSLVAFDLETGSIAWFHQFTADDAFNVSCLMPDKSNCPVDPGPDSDFGAPPILTVLNGGKRALLLGQKSGIVYAVDPDKKGELLWKTRVGKGGLLGGIQWGMATDGKQVFAAVSDLTFTVTPGTGQAQVDPKIGGGISGLKVNNGEALWMAKPFDVCGDRPHCSPAQSAAVTAIPGVVFSGSIDGHLRAYSTATGKVIWDQDTARDYETINRVKAHGGSLDGAGPVVADNMLFVNSGYGSTDLMRGNVLLAFALEMK